MSATGRGAERIEADNYPTPAWCVRRLLEALEFYHVRSPTMSVLEPCVGDGAIVKAMHDFGLNARFVVNDIRDAPTPLGIAVERYTSDFLSWDSAWIDPANPPFDLAITNPPYSCAEEFVQRMLLRARWVAVLVRQGFVGHERAEWMRSNMPDTYELPERPSFAASLKCKPNKGEDRSLCDWSAMVPLTAERPKVCPGCGLRGVTRTTSDAADYCWLVWTPHRDRTEGRRVILPSTSAEERGVKARVRARKALA
jgi:hypothetical protein